MPPMTRDLNVGNALSRIFGIYGDQAGVLLPVAFAVFLLEAIVGAVLVEIAPALIVVALLVQVLASTLYSGMVVELVNDVQDGRRDHSIGGLFGAVTGVVLTLILAGLLVGLLVAIGLVLLIIPGLIVLTLLAVVAPAIVVERKGVFEALSRSRQLVSGNGLQVFGVIFTVFVITFVIGALIGGLGAAAGLGGRIAAEVVASTITAPIGALAAAVLYFELRRAHGEAGPAPHAPGPDAVETGPSTAAPFPGERSDADQAFGERRPEQPGGFDPRA
jgi:MFS family permease